MLSLTMPPSEFQALLDAISAVGERVDGLRSDVFRSLGKLDGRVRDLEIADASQAAVASDRGERRLQAQLSRRAWAGIMVTVGLAALGGLAELVSIAVEMMGGPR